MTAVHVQFVIANRSIVCVCAEGECLLDVWIRDDIRTLGACFGSREFEQYDLRG